MSVITHVEFYIRPDMVGQTLGLLRNLHRFTRAQPGCQSVTVLVNAQNPNDIIVVESWQSLSHAQAYANSVPNRRAGQQIDGISVRPSRQIFLKLAVGA